MRNSHYSTEMRRAALEFLKNNADTAVTAKDISAYLAQNGQNANITSVYRYLDSLLAEGRIKKYVNHKGQQATFQYTGAGGHCDGHLHMQCSECGQIIHLDCEFMDKIAAHIYNGHGFVLDCKTSILYGLCEGCAKRNKT